MAVQNYNFRQSNRLVRSYLIIFIKQECMTYCSFTVSIENNRETTIWKNVIKNNFKSKNTETFRILMWTAFLCSRIATFTKINFKTPSKSPKILKSTEIYFFFRLFSNIYLSLPPILYIYHSLEKMPPRGVPCTGNLGEWCIVETSILNDIL